MVEIGTETPPWGRKQYCVGSMRGVECSLGIVDNRSIGGVRYVGPSRTLERLELQALAGVNQFLLPVSRASSSSATSAMSRCRSGSARRWRSAESPTKRLPRSSGIAETTWPNKPSRQYVERYIRLERYPQENGDPVAKRARPDRREPCRPSAGPTSERCDHPAKSSDPFDFVFINSQLPRPYLDRVAESTW